MSMRIGLVALLLVLSLASSDGQVGIGPRVPRATEVAATTPLSSDSLAKSVTIRRDEYGVPHILADTEHAAAFAHGYATAEDHGAALARLFLRAKGGQASVFGEEFVQEDVLIHTLAIPETAAAKFHDLPPFMQAILNGYAAGYDFYLTQHPDEFPDWATPITGADVLAHCRTVLLIDFALDLRAWRQAAPKGIGSNMWAIGSPLSKSGRGMLLANPHLRWEGSQRLHEVHLTVPGVINVSGATMLGFPVVVMGFNERLGWAHTVNRVDGDDLYELSTDDADRTTYRYDGQWLPLHSRVVSIDVRTDRGVITRKQEVLASHYGPVIRQMDGRTVAFKSANLDLVNFLTQYNRMAKASSYDEFVGAMQMQQLPMFNIAYSDRQGNVWYAFNGRFPRRPSGYNWSGVVPGNTSKTEWFSMRPLNELPQLMNPPNGYLQNCNDAPWYVNLDHRIDRSRYASYIDSDGLGWRGQQSLKILSHERSLTLDALRLHKYDTELLIAQRVKSDLLTLIASNTDPRWREAGRLLEQWNNRIDPDSRAATLFTTWWTEYTRMASTPFRTTWDAARPVDTPMGVGDTALAYEAFGKAIDRVASRYGKLDVVWGDTHRLRRGTLDLPIGGADTTLSNLVYREQSDGTSVAVGGDTYVLAVEFGDTPTAYSVLTYSQSSNTRSRHFSDQATVYAQRQLKRAWFAEADIAGHTEREYHPGDGGNRR